MSGFSPGTSAPLSTTCRLPEKGSDVEAAKEESSRDAMVIMSFMVDDALDRRFDFVGRCGVEYSVGFSKYRGSCVELMAGVLRTGR